MVNAWLVSGTCTKANCVVRANPSSPNGSLWRQLERRWKCATMEAAEADILDAKERVRLKRGATEDAKDQSTIIFMFLFVQSMSSVVTQDDRLVMLMGNDVLKRKRDAMTANPSFVVYADAKSKHIVNIVFTTIGACSANITYVC